MSTGVIFHKLSLLIRACRPASPSITITIYYSNLQANITSYRYNYCFHTKLICFTVSHVYYSFIHSFSHFYSTPSSPLLLRGAPDYSMDTVSEFHDEAHRQL